MRDVLRTMLVSDAHEILGNDRARKGAEQRVLVLVKSICTDGIGQILVNELFAHVNDVCFDGAGAQGLLANSLEAFVLLSNFTDDGNDVHVVLVHEPFDANGRVEATRICEYDLFPICHVFLLFDPTVLYHGKET